MGRTREQQEAEARQADEALKAMVMEFAYWTDQDGGGLTTGGKSALKQAFEVLGWTDPMPMPR